MNRSVCPPAFSSTAGPLDGDLGQLPMERRRRLRRLLADLLARPVIIAAAPPREGPHDRATD